MFQYLSQCENSPQMRLKSLETKRAIVERVSRDGVFGPSVIPNYTLNGGHYNRSVDAQKLQAESMQRLLYKEFFLENNVTTYLQEITKTANAPWVPSPYLPQNQSCIPVCEYRYNIDMLKKISVYRYDCPYRCVPQGAQLFNKVSKCF